MKLKINLTHRDKTCNTHTHTKKYLKYTRKHTHNYTCTIVLCTTDVLTISNILQMLLHCNNIL